MSILKNIALILVSFLCLACGIKNTQVIKPRKVFKVAQRQLPPEPTFSHTRWVRPPLVKPSRDMPRQASSHYISPVVHYKVKNASLKEAALVLATTTRYRSYCSSLIADQVLTLDTLGTLDELAHEISTIAGIRVVVDHPNKEIRFIALQSDSA